MFLDSLVINSLLMVLHYILYTLYLPVVAALMDRPCQGWAPWTAIFFLWEQGPSLAFFQSLCI